MKVEKLKFIKLKTYKDKIEIEIEYPEGFKIDYLFSGIFHTTLTLHKSD